MEVPFKICLKCPLLKHNAFWHLLELARPLYCTCICHSSNLYLRLTIPTALCPNLVVLFCIYTADMLSYAAKSVQAIHQHLSCNGYDECNILPLTPTKCVHGSFAADSEKNSQITFVLVLGPECHIFFLPVSVYMTKHKM